MIAMASAKIKATIIARSIFAAADGFLPTALTAANPTSPTIAAGPSVLKSMIKIIVIFRIFLVLYQHRDFIAFDYRKALFKRKSLYGFII